MLLRPGPYICGEHDLGGLPAYLLHTPGINSGIDARLLQTSLCFLPPQSPPPLLTNPLSSHISDKDLRTNNTKYAFPSVFMCPLIYPPHRYLAQVDEWWRALLPVVANLTYASGGPVAMAQIENEFGSYGGFFLFDGFSSRYVVIGVNLLWCVLKTLRDRPPMLRT